MDDGQRTIGLGNSGLSIPPLAAVNWIDTKTMTYKFENLEVWQLGMEYCAAVYRLSSNLPRQEENNLKVQIRKAATSIVLNIAEGSTGQSDAEQVRFLGMALRSLVETIACIRLMQRLYKIESIQLEQAERDSQLLARKIQAMRKALKPKTSIREEMAAYQTETDISDLLEDDE